jgi:hypothetical protein
MGGRDGCVVDHGEPKVEAGYLVWPKHGLRKHLARQWTRV